MGTVERCNEGPVGTLERCHEGFSSAAGGPRVLAGFLYVLLLLHMVLYSKTFPVLTNPKIIKTYEHLMETNIVPSTSRVYTPPDEPSIRLVVQQSWKVFLGCVRAYLGRKFGEEMWTTKIGTNEEE